LISGRRIVMDAGMAPAYRSCMAEWLTVEVFDGEFPATRWRRAHEDALLEAALTHGASEWLWHETRWGVVLELLFDSDEQLDAYRVLPAVQAALEAVPDRLRGLVVYRGRGGGAGAWVPRRPLPAPLAATAALPDPEPDVFLGPGDHHCRTDLLDDSPGAQAEPAGV
jgi:hypothetical protein